MMHIEAFRFVQETIANLPPRYHVVEFGGRNINGTVRNVFTDAISYVSIDLYPGIGVDIVGDASEYEPLDKGLIDTVICCEVFEHTQKWPQLIKHAYDLLIENGYLICTCATDNRHPHSSLDGNPTLPVGEYYQNVNPNDLSRCISETGFQGVSGFNIQAYQGRGDLYCVAQK